MGSAEPVDTGIDHEVIGVAADTEIDILAAETSPTPLTHRRRASRARSSGRPAERDSERPVDIDIEIDLGPGESSGGHPDPRAARFSS